MIGIVHLTVISLIIIDIAISLVTRVQPNPTTRLYGRIQAVANQVDTNVQRIRVSTLLTAVNTAVLAYTIYNGTLIEDQEYNMAAQESEDVVELFQPVNKNGEELVIEEALADLTLDGEGDTGIIKGDDNLVGGSEAAALASETLERMRKATPDENIRQYAEGSKRTLGISNISVHQQGGTKTQPAAKSKAKSVPVSRYPSTSSKENEKPNAQRRKKPTNSSSGGGENTGGANDNTSQPVFTDEAPEFPFASAQELTPTSSLRITALQAENRELKRRVDVLEVRVSTLETQNQTIMDELRALLHAKDQTASNIQVGMAQRASMIKRLDVVEAKSTSTGQMVAEMNKKLSSLVHVENFTRAVVEPDIPQPSVGVEQTGGICHKETGGKQTGRPYKVSTKNRQKEIVMNDLKQHRDLMNPDDVKRAIKAIVNNDLEEARALITKSGGILADVEDD